MVACIVVTSMVLFCTVVLVLLKRIHDVVKPRREAIIQRYIETAGRVTALVVGTLP
jgi:multiple antibiotic resistance protein